MKFDYCAIFSFQTRPRELLEYLGYTVNWDEQKNTVDLVSNEYSKDENTDNNSTLLATIPFDNPVKTNLKDNGDGEHIVLLGFMLGIQNVTNETDSLSKEINDKEPVTRDTIINSLKNTDFETIQKPDFQEEFSTLIVNEINKVVGKDIVKQFYITDFIIQ